MAILDQTGGRRYWFYRYLDVLLKIIFQHVVILSVQSLLVSALILGNNWNFLNRDFEFKPLLWGLWKYVISFLSIDNWQILRI